MACYYIKNGSLKSPEFSEFEALIKKEKLTNEEENELKKLRDKLGILDNRDFDTLKQSIISKVMSNWSGLEFFSTGFNTQVDSVFQELDSDYKTAQSSKNHKGVTKEVEHLNKARNLYKTGEETKAQKFILDFQAGEPGFGDFVHEFMEQQGFNEEEIVIGKMMDFIKNKRLELTNIQKNYPSDYKTLIDRYPDFISFVEKINDTNLGDSLRQSKLKVKNKFKDYKLKTEQNLAIKNSNGYWITGRLDAFYYKDDGNAAVVDYKTSVKKSWTSTSEFEHYMQLYTYRQMLINKHLGNRQKIKIINIQFTYNQNGVYLDDDGFIDMDNARMGLNEFIKAKRIFDIMFPETGSSATPAEVEAINRKTVDKFNKLFDIKTVQKLDEKYLKEDLERRYSRGETFYSFKADLACNVKKESDGTFTLSYIDNTGTTQVVYDHKSIKDISYEEQINIQRTTKDKTLTIIEKIKNGNPEGLKQLLNRSREDAEALYQNLSKYLNSNWTVYPCEPLENLGIIMFKNIDGTIDLVSLCPQHGRLNYQLDDSQNIISAISSKKFPGVPTKSIGNALKLKALIAFSEWAQTVNPTEKFIIGDIKVVSLKNGQGTREINQPFINCLEELEKKSPDFAGIYTGLMAKAQFASPIRQLQTELTDALGAHASNLIGNIFDNFDELSIIEKKKRLRNLQYKIITQFGTEIVENYDPKHPEHFDPSKVRVDTDAGKLLATVSKLILQLDGLRADNPEMVSKHGVTMADTASALLQLFIRGEIQNFTDQGRKVTGIFGGMDMASTYNNPSVYVDYANKRITACHNVIKTEFIHSIDESNQEAIRFIKYEIEHGIITGGKVTDALLGNHNQAYIRLLKEIDGNKIPEFKNPYKDGSLNEAEKRYLKQLLWHINRLKLPDSILPAKYKQLSYAELEKDPEAEKKFKDILESRKDALYMPLKPSSRIRGKLAIMADFINGKRNGSDIWDKVKKGLANMENPNDLAVDQLDRQNKSISKFEIFNTYRDSEDSRQEMMEKRQLSDFELNFNFLENDMELAYIKEKHDKQLIPYIQDIILQLQLINQTTGVDMSSQVQAILDRVKIMIYGDNLIEAEDKEAMGSIGVMKHALSLVKLGLRPALAVKELTVGRLKNFSTVAAGILVSPTGNKVSVNNLISAGTEVVPDGLISGNIGAFVGHHELGEFTKVEQLNQDYQITDSDMNTISDSASADHYGIANVGERALYYFSVRPDWYNRNILFVACMKQDGCWKAHKFDKTTGKLSYDMAEDERFSEFWRHRNDAHLSEKAMDQKALYIAMMQEFIKDNPNADLHYGEEIDENGHAIYSKLPKAYTSLQTIAIKEQIGMIYGMYDHEEKSNMENQMMWNMLTSMLTYLPGDIHRYFMKKGQTSIGSYKHVENAQGEKLYYDEEGNKVTESKNADGTNRLPVKEWVGDQVEGLFISTLSVLGKIGRGSWEFVTKGETNTFKTITDYQLRNAAVCLFNILFKILFAAILINLIKGDRKDSELDQMSAMAIDTIRRASNDLDFYNSVVKPIDEFGIAGVSFMQDIAGDVISVMGSGNADTIERLYTNISTIKDLHLDLS